MNLLCEMCVDGKFYRYKTARGLEYRDFHSSLWSPVESYMWGCMTGDELIHCGRVINEALGVKDT